MTAMDRQILRERILTQLNDASPAALGLSTLTRGVQLGGFNRLLDYDVERELRYLGDKNLVEEKTSELSRALKNWRITATGRDYLEEQGLA